RRVDEMAERVEAVAAQPEKEPGGEPRRSAGIALRLALVRQHGIEHVAAEAGIGTMAGLAGFITEETVQPAVRLAALNEVVDELDMAPLGLKRVAVQKLVHVDGELGIAGQAPEAPPRDFLALRIDDEELDRQLALRGRHGRRLHLEPPALGRQERGRQD